LRSAAATSGRRCSSSEGTEVGVGGAPGDQSAIGWMVRLAGGWPIRTAMACSAAVRARSRSTRLALALVSWVWAVSTSLLAATPTLYRFCVTVSERPYASTVACSSAFWASVMRSWK